jgi:hypothetical protein
VDTWAGNASEIAVCLAAASLTAAHLLSKQASAATNRPLQLTSACNNGKIAAYHTHCNREPHDRRKCCTNCCPHLSRLSCAVALYVLSMRRCVATASAAASLTLTALQQSSCMTHRRTARRAWPRLAWWLLDMCVINAFQLWSKGHHHPGQLRFREELMHELLQQLPVDDKPRQHGGHRPPPGVTAGIHSSELVAEDRDCKQCSRQPGSRKRTNYICSECQVHLCLGTCFRAYHADV